MNVFQPMKSLNHYDVNHIRQNGLHHSLYFKNNSQKFHFIDEKAHQSHK